MCSIKSEDEKQFINHFSSTLDVTGSVTIVNDGTASDNSVYFGNIGAVTVGVDLDITNAGANTRNQVSVASSGNSSLTVGGNCTVVNSATGGTNN